MYSDDWLRAIVIFKIDSEMVYKYSIAGTNYFIVLFGNANTPYHLAQKLQMYNIARRLTLTKDCLSSLPHELDS